MYKQRTVRVVIVVRVLAVYRQKRKTRYKLHALPERITGRRPVWTPVVGIKAEHTPRKHIHHIRRGILHYYIAHEIGRQRAVIAEHFIKARQLVHGGKRSEKQQIRRFLKAESPSSAQPFHQVVDVHAAVEKLAFAGRLVPVLVHFESVYLGNFRKSANHTVAVQVAQTALYVVFFVEPGIYRAFTRAQFRKPRYLRAMLFLQRFLIFLIIHFSPS